MSEQMGALSRGMYAVKKKTTEKSRNEKYNIKIKM